MFTKFHGVPHYAYMKLKMSEPNDVITVKTNMDTTLQDENKTTTLGLKAEFEDLEVEELLGRSSKEGVMWRF